MKKAFIPLAAVAVALASCDTGVKDSTSTNTYNEYNLIVDLEDEGQPAQVSVGSYKWTYNLTKNQIDVAASEVTINNQNYSFETDPMNIDVTYFTTADGLQVDKMSFSQSTPNSSVAGLKGTFIYWVSPSTGNLLDIPFKLATFNFLDINYTLSGRYRVQSFWCNSYYTGNSSVTEEGASYGTKTTTYFVQIDFKKNLAGVMIYYPEYAAKMPEEYPKVMCLSEIPVKFMHDRYRLEAAAPKTTIMGKNDKGQTDLVESDNFKAYDFTLDIVSPDLTEAAISYKLNDRQYTFQGCTVLKSGK